MKPILTVVVALSAILAAAPGSAALNVFACEPEWGALAQELGGDRVSVFSATTALQDPHRIEARPSLIARVRSAGLVVCSGAELEAAWLPVLLAQAGNPRVQAASRGLLYASQHVTRLEIPGVIDRSQGDIHPGGNPHVHLDPRNIAKIAEVLSARLVELDPGSADIYRSLAASFQQRWRAAMSGWEAQGSRLGDVPLVVYHKNMSYFVNWMRMREVGSLEPKPGIPPTPSHLVELVARMKREPAKLVVYTPYNDPRAAEFLSQRTGIPAVMLPYTVGGSERAKDLFGLFDDTIARLLAALR